LHAHAAHATACDVKTTARLAKLSAIELNGDELPTEFRIFAAGANETQKGTTIFDAEAAEAVMAAYQKHGVDLMIDLEHESLDETATRADSRDARGWFKLEVRNGELWAVDVRWTPDGEARLREKRQRYVSPAFIEDQATSRAVRLVNVAICAMPATHNAAPLVAASEGAPSQTDVRNALDAAVRALIPPGLPGACAPCPWIVDVFPDRAIFEHDGKLYAVGYTYADGTASLVGKPVHVVREYVPAGPVALRALRASLAMKKSRATAAIAPKEAIKI
jgi:hypothetical protein